MCVYYNVAIGLRPCTFTLNMKHTVEDMPRLHKLFHRDKHRTGYSLQTWSWWFFIYIYFAHIDLFWYNFVLYFDLYIRSPMWNRSKAKHVQFATEFECVCAKEYQRNNFCFTFLYFFFCCLLFHLMFFLYIL